MADRMAMLMVDLVRRDFDYGKFCFEEFYVGEIPDHLRKSKEYRVCIDFVRMMLRKHDEQEREKSAQREAETPAEATDASAGGGVAEE